MWQSEEMNEFLKPSNSKSKCCGTRHLSFYILACLVSTISIVSITLSVYNFLTYTQLKDQATKRSNVCVICTELYPKDDVDGRAKEMIASLDRHMDDGVQICCARNNKERNQIMRLQLKRTLSVKYLPTLNSTKIDINNFLFDGIMAQKSLGKLEKKEPKFGDELYTVPLRKNLTPPFEYASGVDVMPYGLKVKVAGLYFVYKSILFIPNSPQPCKHLNDQIFRSLLLRNSTRRASRTDVLLRSEHTCCPDCKENRETSFTGGVFYLDKGDLIHVEISAYGLVYFKDGVTYMGITLVSVPAPKHIDV